MPYRDPERQREAKRESARRSRSSSTGTRGSTPGGGTVEPEGAQAVEALLWRWVREVELDTAAGTLTKGRTIAYMATALLRAREAGELEERVQALEAAAAAGNLRAVR